MMEPQQPVPQEHATLDGVEAGDDVILRRVPVFTFASANVGTGITINTSGLHH